MRSASRTFSPSPESVGGARQFAGRTVASWGADGLADDVRVVTSELATNALLHARTTFTLTLALEGTRLRLTLADGSGARPRARRFDRADSTTGRGLLIVDELAQAWGVEADGAGKLVWCEFDLPSRGGRGDDGDDEDRPRRQVLACLHSRSVITTRAVA